MPTYVYKFVKTGETIEVQQAFSDDTLTKIKHPDTGRHMAVKKVFQPVGVTFKGSGFFKTDNRDSKATTPPGSTSDASGTSSDTTASSSSETSGGSTSEASSGTSAKTESSSKPAAKPKPKPKSSSSD